MSQAGIINVAGGGGNIGEAISSSVLNSSAISLTQNTAADLTSVLVTAGDWDVYGNVFFNGTGVSQAHILWISTTSATVPDLSLISDLNTSIPSNNTGCPAPFRRFSFTMSTRIYISCQTSGTGVTASGNIFAIRAA